MLIVTIFNLEINIILRISGRIRKNYFRSIIWKMCKHKIKFITCPSIATKNDIIKMNIFDENKILEL